MTGKPNLPIESNAFRFAPGRGGSPATWFWRIWTEGNEIYALTRNTGGIAKISVHQSGQIHYRLGPKHKQDLTPTMQLLPSPWLHAFEIRFLISDDVNAPPEQRDSLKKKSANVIQVPAGSFLVVNLLVSAAGAAAHIPLPVQFSGANVLWRATLPDGRRAVLIARILELDTENRKKLDFYHKELKLNVTVNESGQLYTEIHHLHWSAGGNIIMVVPLAPEAVRVAAKDSRPITKEDKRSFHFQSPRASLDIVAPDGSTVAVLELDFASRGIELVKDRPHTHKLGIVSLRLDPSKLIAGGGFIGSPTKLMCVPTISGASPRDWTYTLPSRYDGVKLRVSIQQMSVSLQNKNLAVPMEDLGDGEELILQIPSETLNIEAAKTDTKISADIQGYFLLRDQH
jgi:hypothetical protein